MSYRLQSAPRLESPRPRPPLRIRAQGFAPSSPTTLLYDVPQSARSPPPDAPARRASPEPSASPPRPRARASPSPHSRATTPAQELDQFAEHCRAWYFRQDDAAGQRMAATLEALAAPQRPHYARVQASIRSAFHAATSRRRHSEFRAHLSSTSPGGSLAPHARARPRAKAAQRERRVRFLRFLRTWCTSGMPGTQPFFHALWALLRLQVLPVALGGAGARRIEWELDDAVFQESAGKDFMLDAIDILKGVLGFEECLLPPRHSDELQPPPPPPPPPAPDSRPRSPSDPFLDTPPASQRTAVASPDAPKERPDDAGEPALRLWTAPDLDNPELQHLISLFPDLTSQALPRFNTAHGARRGPDLEQGLEIARDSGAVRCGTGRLWVGAKERREGWRGSWWQKLVAWWRRFFC